MTAKTPARWIQALDLVGATLRDFDARGETDYIGRTNEKYRGMRSSEGMSEALRKYLASLPPDEAAEARSIAAMYPNDPQAAFEAIDKVRTAREKSATEERRWQAEQGVREGGLELRRDEAKASRERADRDFDYRAGKDRRDEAYRSERDERTDRRERRAERRTRTKDQFDMEKTLRDDWQQATKRDFGVLDAFNNLEAAFREGNEIQGEVRQKPDGTFEFVGDPKATEQRAAADLALIVAYAKALDPESVVREGEVTIVRATEGVSQQVAMLWQRVKNGETVLNEATRKQLYEVASGLRERSVDNLRLARDEYTATAGEYDLDINRIMTGRSRLAKILDGDAGDAAPADGAAEAEPGDGAGYWKEVSLPDGSKRRVWVPG